jgi:hypothetical protein
MRAPAASAMLSMQIFQQDGLALKNESFDKLNIFSLVVCVQLRQIKEMTGERIISYFPNISIPCQYL